MVEQRPVQTSAVYLVGASQCPTEAPPSPPSPVTPGASDLCTSVDELSLGDVSSRDCHAVSTVAGVGLAKGPRPHDDVNGRIAGAVHALSAEANTLHCLTQLYSTDSVARDGFIGAVAAITDRCGRSHGKLVISGVGKSGHIGRKLVATFNSIGLPAAFLHPTEALHGDIGLVGPVDALMLITFSGSTPELLALLPHLNPSLPLILLTGHTRPETCELWARCRRRPLPSGRPEPAILLPAPVHEPESVTFGVSAPTSSTTAALAVGDALAIVAAQELHGRGRDGVSALFASNHPGGAIGAAISQAPAPLPAPSPPPISHRKNRSIATTATATATATASAAPSNRTVRHISIPWSDIPPLPAPAPALTGGDVLRAGYASPSGWVRLPPIPGGGEDAVVPPSQILRLDSADLARPLPELPGLAVRRRDFVAVAADSTVRRAAGWVREVRGHAGEGDATPAAGPAVVGVVEGGECVGVLEVVRLLEESAACGG